LITIYCFKIDVVLFRQPSKCARSKAGCDWTELGVGKSDVYGNVRYCCTLDASSIGLCNADNNKELGRLIIDEDLFKGKKSSIFLPKSGDVNKTMGNPHFLAQEGDGQYALVLSNCNDSGRNVNISGPHIWKSKHGFLPANLNVEWMFYIILTILYFCLFLWFCVGMCRHRDSLIQIQKWISITILAGVLELSFHTLDYWVWDESGTRATYTIVGWMSLSIIKRSISRCLLVMVCLGWGVIRDDLGGAKKKLILLGFLYVVVASGHDITEVVVIKDLETLKVDEEKSAYDAFTIFSFLNATVDVIFYMWILDSLGNTMQYLENMNQQTKLKRFLKLRLILLFSILFSLVWAVFSLVDASMEPAMLNDGMDWFVYAAWNINYLLVLFAISVLWSPTKNARDYAYTMELPMDGGDMELTVDSVAEDEDNEKGFV